MFRFFAIAVVCLSVVKPNVLAQTNPDLTLLQRARLEYHLGNLSAAEALFTNSLRTIPPDAQEQRASILGELGDVYLNEDELAKAEHAYTESLTIYKRLSSKTGIALALRNLGAVYSLQRRNDEALDVLKKAQKLTKPIDVNNASLAAQVLNSLGVAHYRMGKSGKAEDYFIQAQQVVSTFKVRFDTAELLNNLGAVYYEKRNYQKAELHLNQALNLTQERVGASHPDLIFSLSALGVLYTALERYDEAIAQFDRALKIVEPQPEVFDTRIARLLHGIARAHQKAGRLDEAGAALSKATVIARRNLAPHPDMVSIIEDYSAMLKKQGKAKEAEELRVEARRVRVNSTLVINAHHLF